jgi:uncharacterized protein YndB with AHSA1/START domain
MRLEQQIHIARPPQEVFAFVTDTTRLADWQKGTVEVRRSGSGPLAVGEQLHEVHAALGKRMESVFEVTRADPGRAFTLKAVDGPVLLDGHWEFAADNGGTEVRFVGEGPVRGWMKPLLARQFRGHHKRLKRLLESE